MFEDTDFLITPAQDRALDVITSDATHVALGGGSRCVAGDTVLDGHTLTIAELAELGKPVRVLTSHGSQMAEAPFRKGSARLYEVVTESGRRIEVTSDHRFWNGDRWIRTNQLVSGSLVACRSSSPFPQVSNSEHDLLTSFLNVPNWTQKFLSYLGDYFCDFRRYGPQPHLSSVSDSICRALQFDEQVRTQRSQYHLDLFSQLPELNTHKGHLSVPWLKYIRIDPQLFRFSNMDGSPSSCPAFGWLIHVFSRTYGLFRSLPGGGRLSNWLLHQFESCRVRIDNYLSRYLPFFYHGKISSCGDTPLRSGYTLEKVSTITTTTVKDYYTLHVPATEQYFANGILHHNSGKTFLLVLVVLLRAIKSPFSRHAIFRFRFNSIKASIIYDTLPTVLRICFPQLPSHLEMLNKTDWFLTLPNGSEIWFGGLDDKDRTEKILGQEFATIYFNECSQIPWASVVMALTRLAQKAKRLKLKAFYDFNPPSKKHWTYLRFVEKRDPETKRPEKNEFDFAFYLINPSDNRQNLDTKYLEILDSLPEKARNRFLLGRFADDTDGSLWNEELLAQNRRLGNEELPMYLRIVISVDPSGCSGPEDTRSDEIGITVCALGTDSHGYLLEDLSGQYSPEGWADVVCEAYERHQADRVVGEVNYGGDMVRAVLQSKDPDIPFTAVTATRGKVVRAEPIAALYEQNKIHHVGYFPELEDQLCSMTTGGYQGLKSPDRADSAIWGWTELFPKMTRKLDEENIPPPKVRVASRSASRFDRSQRRRRY